MDFCICKPSYQLHKVITKCSLKKCFLKIFIISASTNAVKLVQIKA